MANNKKLLANELDCPTLFPIRLPIPGRLSHPRFIDSSVDLGDLPLTRNTVTGWALFIKKAQRIFSPCGRQHLLFLNV